MALALVLRNVSRLPAGIFQPHSYVKVATVALSRDFSTLLHQKKAPIFIKNENLNVVAHSRLGLPQLRMMSSDHSKLWPLEKAISVSLLLIFPAAIIAPNFVFDNLLAAASVIHFHWGLEACIADYVRPIIVGNILPKLTMGLLYLISATTLGGLIYYNVNDIGIGRTIRKIWSINKGEGGTGGEGGEQANAC